MNQTKILKLYTPHEKQRELHECTARFVVSSWGRQSGKSTWAINQLTKMAWTRPNTKYWFVSPTYAQSRVMYRRLVGMLWPAMQAVWKKNQSELRVKLANQSEIRFVSGEVFDNLRGETLNGAIIDEVRDQHPDLWPMVIRPMLATTGGFCSFISTPSGFDHFYDLAKNAEGENNWAFFKAPSTANPLFTQEEFESARRSMSESEFSQEILAEFRDLTAGKAYISFGDYNLGTECPWSPGKQISPYHSIVVGMDFNLSPMSWTLGQNAADRWWWFDEVYLEQSHTQEAAFVLRDKVLALKKAGFKAEPNLIICGDATGKATQRTSNRSDYDVIKEVLKAAGISFRDETPESNPSVKDRINTVNASLKDATGVSHVTIHPVKCKKLKEDMERVTWREGRTFELDQSKDSKRTHPSDSIGYPICKLTPIKGVREIGRTRIIQRVL